MRNAHECAPKTCQCGRRLGKPQYGYPFPRELKLSTFTMVTADPRAPIKEEVWHIPCTCGVVHVWSFHPKSNGCWKIRSMLPLLDSGEITKVA